MGDLLLPGDLLGGLKPAFCLGAKGGWHGHRHVSEATVELMSLAWPRLGALISLKPASHVAPDDAHHVS